MKILHVITSLWTGGAEHLMVDLLPRLRQLGHEVELLVFDGTRTPFYEQLAAAGITIHCLSKGGNVYHPRNLWRLVRFVRRHHYDIIHTHNTACQLFAALASVLCSVVLVTTEHNTSNRRRGWRWYAPVDRWMYGRYRHIICISDQAERNLVAHIGHHPGITTIYNGVDTGWFARAIKDISTSTGFIITMVAGFRYQKDQDTLMRAVALLPQAYRLWLIGDGERRGELTALAHELGIAGRVWMPGVRTDVAQLMEQSDAIVLSSHFEGLSLSSIEGMASGRPFIASDVDGLREVVDGYGVMFAHGDARELAAAISGLCENPARYSEVARRCQLRAGQFDISLMAQKYNELYLADN